uniref:Myb-like domain-containing protein n=1 Tax=Cucumis melo TaxID=3656 RepID=A0A9I9DL89_CUCME
MSDPPTTSSEPPHHQQQQQHLPRLPVIHGGASGATRMNTAAATSSSAVIVREYRKGNWTLQETMILITAKKLDDERRNKANLGPSTVDPAARKGGELRWKWVENYCWSHGCQRSQNQCNDKWDNLLRDYKKVREYESRACDQQIPSYWKMEKHERKDKNLPSNMAFEVYQALNDVVQRKFSQKPSNSSNTGILLLPLPAPPPSTLLPPPTATNSPQLSESSSSGTESSEKKEKMEAKRRKMEDNIGRRIERSVSALGQTLHSCEEQREIRHQQLMELRKRRLQIEETRNHIHRQGIADLVAAVANLSAGIDNNRRGRSEGYESCLYSGEEVRILKEQNEAMQAELMNVKNELSQLRDQMPSLMQTMMHSMIHNIPPPPPPSTSSMDPSGSGRDA